MNKNASIKIYDFNSLHLFETKNHWKLFEDIDDEDVQDIMNKVQIKTIPKKRLRKCRYCNFKKRSCLLDKSSCKAVKKVCGKCKKPGHYPKSLNCKQRRKLCCHLNKRNLSMKASKVKKPKHQSIYERNKMDENLLGLVKDRIMKIEQIQKSKEKNQQSNTQPIIQPKLVPFLMMYICFNFEYIYPSHLIEKSLLESNLKKKIFKTAKDCAKKFSSMSNTISRECFQKYCSKKIKKILNTEHIPNLNKAASIPKIVDLFDNLYYKNGAGDTEIKMDHGLEHQNTIEPHTEESNANESTYIEAKDNNYSRFTTTRKES